MQFATWPVYPTSVRARERWVCLALQPLQKRVFGKQLPGMPVSKTAQFGAEAKTVVRIARKA